MTDLEADLAATLGAAVDGDQLVALARNLLRGDDAGARDALAQALCAAVEHGPRRQDSAFTWLATTTRRFALRELRGRSRRARRERGASLPERDDVSPADVVAREEARQRLVNAVIELDEPLRQVVLARYWSGWTCAAIARRNREPESTVRDRLRRAYTQLRRSLGSEYDDRARWHAALLPLLDGPRPDTAVGHGLAPTGLVAGGLIMSFKLWVTAAAIVVLLVLGRGWFGGDNGGPVTTEATAPTVDGEASATGSAASEATAVASAQPFVPDREATSSTAEAVASEEAITVRIVKAPGNTPIPFAQLRVRELTSDPAHDFLTHRNQLDEWDPERDLRHARLVEADERGEATLHVDAARCMFGSRHGSYFGHATVDTLVGGRHELVLVDDPDLRVRVVNESGVPASGVLTTLEHAMAAMPQSHAIRRAVTDEAGVAVLTRVRSRMERFGAAQRRFFVTLGGAFDERPEVRIDPIDLPDETITLTAPSMGSVEIEFQDDTGAPYHGPLAAGIARSPLPESVFPRHGDLWWRAVENGRVTFPVGVATPVGVYAFAPDERIDPIRLELTGPAVAGGRVVHVARVAAERHTLRGRLQDTGGVFLDRRVIHAWYDYPGAAPRDQRNPEANALTDEAGDFALAMPHEVLTARPTQLVVHTREPDGLVRKATVALLPIEEAGMTTFLGSIAVTDPPLLIEGRVVDAEGSALSAQLSFDARRAGRWRSTVGLVRSRGDGSFTWRGWIEDDVDQVRPVAHLEGYMTAAPPEVSPGSIDVTVQMVRAASLHGSIADAAGIPPHRLIVTLEGENSVQATTRRSGPRVSPDATSAFDLANLAPGRVSLVILDDDTRQPAPLVRVDDLVLEAGAANRDPRVQNIRLDARAVVVDVVDPAGTPIEGALVLLQPVDATPGLPRTRYTDAVGRSEVLIDRHDYRLVVAKVGFNTVRAGQVAAHHGVTLEPAPMIRVHVVGVDLSSGLHMIRMMPRHPSSPDLEVQRRWLQEGLQVNVAVGADGIAELYAAEPGAYTITLCREAQPGYWPTIARMEVTAPDGGGSQVVTLAADF